MTSKRTLLHCCCSVTKSCRTLCNAMDCSTPGFPVFHYLPEFVQTQVHWVNDAIQPSYPLSPLSLPALNLSKYQGLLMSWLFTSFGQGIGASASVLPMNIIGWFPLGLIWFDLAVQGTLKSLLQHNSKASILQHLAFFMVQLSHPYMNTGNSIVLIDCMDLCQQSFSSKEQAFFIVNNKRRLL